MTVNELVMFDNFTWGLFFICSLPIVAVAALSRLVQGTNNSFHKARKDGPLTSSRDDIVLVIDGD